MSDTQFILDTLTDALEQARTTLRKLNNLPFHECCALRPAIDVQKAVVNMLERRIDAHSNALQVQS